MRINLKIFFITFTLVLSSCKSAGWRVLQPQSSPPPMADGRAVYDMSTESAILFGGVTGDNTLSDQTWEWDGQKWYKVFPVDHPGARAKQAMAYDQARNKIVLFGGWDGKSVFNDTWEWDGKNWKNIKPNHRPTARCCHAMAYDVNSERIVMYGGWDSATGDFYDDVWLWDGVDWEEMDSTGLPLMSGHSMSEFPNANQIISVSATKYVNTWALTEGQWADLGVNPVPTRSEGRVAFDPFNQVLIYFGGIKDGEYLNDTWVFDGENWYLLKLDSAPLGRFGHVMFYDPTQKAVILFGGINSTTYYNDTWAFSLPNDIHSISLPTPTQIPTP